MPKSLMVGITGNAVVHSDRDNFDVDTRFRMAKEAGFDYYDKTPPTGELEIYQKASAKHALPIRAGGFYYTRGRDEPLLEWHLRVAKELGSVVQNIQIKPKDANGTRVPDGSGRCGRRPRPRHRRGDCFDDCQDLRIRRLQHVQEGLGMMQYRIGVMALS